MNRSKVVSLQASAGQAEPKGRLYLVDVKAEQPLKAGWDTLVVLRRRATLDEEVSQAKAQSKLGKHETIIILQKYYYNQSTLYNGGQEQKVEHQQKLKIAQMTKIELRTVFNWRSQLIQVENNRKNVYTDLLGFDLVN